MTRQLLTLTVLATGTVLADQLILATGQNIVGQFLGADRSTLRFVVGDSVKTYSLADVLSIRFGGEASTPAPVKQPAVAARSFAIPAGQWLEVTLLDPLSDTPGKIYRASVFAPVFEGGQIVIPQKAECEIATLPQKLTQRLAQPGVVVLQLQSIKVNGQSYPVSTRQATVKTSQVYPGELANFLLTRPVTITP